VTSVKVHGDGRGACIGTLVEEIRAQVDDLVFQVLRGVLRARSRSTRPRLEPDGTETEQRRVASLRGIRRRGREGEQ